MALWYSMFTSSKVLNQVSLFLDHASRKSPRSELIIFKLLEIVVGGWSQRITATIHKLVLFFQKNMASIFFFFILIFNVIFNFTLCHWQVKSHWFSANSAVATSKMGLVRTKFIFSIMPLINPLDRKVSYTFGLGVWKGFEGTIMAYNITQCHNFFWL